MKIIRDSVTPVAAFVALLIAQVINLRVGPQPWEGEVLLSSTWVWTATYLAGPVIAAVAAWDGARLLPCSGVSGSATSADRRQLAARLWVASALGAILPTMVVLGSMAGSFYGRSLHADVDQSAFVTIVAGILTIVAIIGMGLVLGSWWGSRYGVIAAFVASLLIQMVSYFGSAPVLMLGGVSDSLMGLALTRDATIVQIVGLAALLAAIGYALLSDPTKRLGSVPRTVSVLALGLLPALILPQLAIPRFEAVPEMEHGVSCIEMGPDSRPGGIGTVCTHLEHQRLSYQVQRTWGEISLMAANAGVRDFPTLLAELPRSAGPDDVPEGEPGSAVTYTLTPDQLDIRRGEVSVEWLIDSITTPTWCPGLWADQPPGDEIFEPMIQARESLLALAGDLTADEVAVNRDRFEAAWAALKGCPGM